MISKNKDFRLEVAYLADYEETLGKHTVYKADSYLNLKLDKVITANVLTISANITQEQAQQFLDVVVNPVTQEGFLGQKKHRFFDYYIVVGYLAGVTDNVARSARELGRDVFGRSLTDDEYIFSSREYFVYAQGITLAEIEKMAQELLANVLINSVVVLSYEQWFEQGAVENKPLISKNVDVVVNHLSLKVSDEELSEMSSQKTLALTLEEMKVIQQYIKKVSNDESRIKLGLSGIISDAELECLAQTWSEHCKHKIFSANINYVDENGQEERIKSLYKSFIQKSTKEIGEKVDWLVSVFKDNAGVISFNDKYDLVYKTETHNSPSALDPYGGSMTGIVGVNRDPMGTGMGANLLINVWGYCLGPLASFDVDVPKGLLHPRRIRDGVHQGVIDGGNQSGIPYGLGWEYFDKRFIGKPLVYCGTIGLLPRQLHGKSGAKKHINVGDLIVMTGGRIGKDGIHGATFSSEELHNDSPIQAVQIGDPITQKCMYDFIMEARDKGLYNFVTDNGAGGLSSSIGEMSEETGGCHMDLAKAPLKYSSLQPWEILVSEAQERMSFAIPPEKIEAFEQLAKCRNVEIAVLGEFNDSGKFHIVYGNKTACYLDLDFMHNGLPAMELKAVWKAPNLTALKKRKEPLDLLALQVLASVNIRANEDKSRQYDHEVKGLSVIKPFVGRESNVSSDATVFMAEPVTREGIVLAYGIAPSYSDIDTYHMMASIIDLAVRRTVAVGGNLDKIAGLDNFCWPDPVQSVKTPDGEYKLAQLVRANKALYDYCKAFQVPCISGKDSMKNDSTKGNKKISIPPTVLFSTIATMKDIDKAVNLVPKQAGDLVFVVGQTYDELGGSQYALLQGELGEDVPKVDASYALSIYSVISEAIEQELCQSVHTPSFGGLIVGLAKMAIAGELSLTVDLGKVNSHNLVTTSILFSESNSRFIITVKPSDKDKFIELTKEIDVFLVGKTGIVNDGLTVRVDNEVELKLGLEQLKLAYKEGIV